MDPWFESHYSHAARTIHGMLSTLMPLAGARLLDFGCGDGTTAAGAAALGLGFVVGADTTASFNHLPLHLAANLGHAAQPSNLAFVQIDRSCRLPFAPGAFDAAYSWSVFEHLADIPAALEALRAALRPGGLCLIQIEPLYHSPYGSHLQRLTDIPWGHLLMSTAAFTALAEATPEHAAAPDTGDLLYSLNEFAAYKKHLVEQFLNLNRVTVRQLLHHVRDSGLTPVRVLASKAPAELVPPPQLLCVHSLEDLTTSAVYLLLRR
ncbi:Ubiquinone biosynthesis O-methyltransferase [Fundidesulfovibrio magnetotacticus]|uniref:Ubiquinone biosynthesis O-methyltransferase n=1 Tax=Fundidesulfovibrio magnetotacticus TaxID=2730080 RepID=A0A6V8LNS7_9BACT|nr:methyltransferase domain-containing protein [Fundidesulfovibrio magnetotacticus]GFK93354.1 Ubiquinone biosynthesis O-methyltransferase [Fundidesulfovibrio magnetotacticus]